METVTLTPTAIVTPTEIPTETVIPTEIPTETVIAGDALGYDLRANPELVAQNAEISWATGLWFWMTSDGAGSMTCHEAITGGFGFGQTIQTINGGQECNGAWPSAVEARVQFYLEICGVLGVDPGSNLYC